MKTRSNQLEKPLFFLFLCILMCCAETGRAVEPMYGQMTTNVNLRSSHGLHGKIITEIEKGEKVLVKDKIGDWYKVIVEKKTYGYIGWVYGKYLKKIYIKEEKAAPPLDTRIIEATYKEAHSEDPFDIKEGKKPALLDKTQEDTYLLESIPAIRKVEKTQPIEREESEITPESVSPENFLSSKEEKKQNILDETQKYAHPLWSIPVIEENEKSQSPILKSTDDLIGHFGMADFMKLLLRLVTIVLSCLSLLLSYKALQLTIKVPTMKAIASSLIAFLHSMTRIRIPLMNNTTSSRVS
jgi:hypothetical protein